MSPLGSAVINKCKEAVSEWGNVVSVWFFSFYGKAANLLLHCDKPSDFVCD